MFSGKDRESPERITLEGKYKGRAIHEKYGVRYAKLLDRMNIASGLEYYRLQKTFRTINIRVIIRLADLRKGGKTSVELSLI